MGKESLVFIKEIIKLLQKFCNEFGDYTWIIFTSDPIEIHIRYEYINRETGKKCGPDLFHKADFIWKSGKLKKIKRKNPWYCWNILKLGEKIAATGCKDFIIKS